MEQVINYWAVLACGIFSMGFGALWYGPFFGKKWMEIVGADAEDKEARKKMKKSAGPLYAVQFVLSLFQIWVLAGIVSGTGGVFLTVLWIWLAFIMPTLAGVAMWNNDTAKVAWSRFLIQAGYQLISFGVFALILSVWK
ncbi:MAG: DUF1761 domain-containing protein [Candidatus Taylorbacteria bacterium]|nr:DUF1761 domain-containing protein [Candidatus Taylorbacteria bacterium]